MGYINRFLLFLYALAIAVLSLGAVSLCLQLVPEYVIVNELRFILSRWETIAVAVVVFLWSIHLLGCSISSSSHVHQDKEVILVQGSSGEVRVAVEAVKNMAEKTARMISGVREAKVEVTSEKQADGSGRVRLDVKASLGQEQNVARVSDAIRAAIGQHMTQVIGIPSFEIRISVTDISNAAVAKKQRVV
jgi:uncharacterized alkaline shock family protein YloU